MLAIRHSESHFPNRLQRFVLLVGADSFPEDNHEVLSACVYSLISLGHHALWCEQTGEQGHPAQKDNSARKDEVAQSVALLSDISQHAGHYVPGTRKSSTKTGVDDRLKQVRKL